MLIRFLSICLGIITRPSCLQVYNLFHPTDPVAARLEPLLSARFSILPPVNVARYAKYPLGNGQPYHLRKYTLSKKLRHSKKKFSNFFFVYIFKKAYKFLLIYNSLKRKSLSYLYTGIFPKVFMS